MALTKVYNFIGVTVPLTVTAILLMGLILVTNSVQIRELDIPDSVVEAVIKDLEVQREQVQQWLKELEQAETEDTVLVT